MRAVFNSRSIQSIITEVREFENVETGGILLGTMDDDVVYVYETIFPGPKSVHRDNYFEYDQEYVNYTVNKVISLYNNKIEIIGLWHRHLGDLDEFSKTDLITNEAFAELSSQGIISGIVTINPDFCFRLFYVSPNKQYKEITFKKRKKYLWGISDR